VLATWLTASTTAILLAACTPGPLSATKAASAASPGRATVDRVIDGDTLIADVNGKSTRVRLIGMDTPETVDPKKPVECFGPQASSYTKSLLPKGTPIQLDYDSERKDVYGRTLAYVYRRRDGMFINAQLVEQGYAFTLTIPPNTKHSQQFTQLLSQARQRDLGLWAACPADRTASKPQ
jgi:micrococcal nuclease